MAKRILTTKQVELHHASTSKVTLQNPKRDGWAVDEFATILSAPIRARASVIWNNRPIMSQQTTQISRQVEARDSIPGMSFEVSSATIPDVMEFSGLSDAHRITLVLKPLPELRQCVFPTVAPHPYLFGRINFVPASFPYRILTAGGSHRWLTLNIEPEFLRTLTNHADDWDLEASSAIEDQFLERSLHRLANELVAPTLAGNILKTALCETVAGDLARLTQRREKRAHTRSTLSRSQFRTLMDYIESKDGVAPTTAELAAILGISRGYLSQLFKETTGSTLHKYVDIARCHRAKTLLADRALTIKEVSYRLGFPQPSCFSSAFRRTTGQSPTEYRAKIARRR